MAIDLRIEIPRRRLDRLIDPKAVQWAEAQALNRTAGNVQTEALKLVSSKMGISTSKLKKRGVFRGGRKFGAVSRGRRATRRRPETLVRASGRPFNVSRFDAQPVLVNGRTVATSHTAYGRRQIAKRTWQLRNGAVVVRSGVSFRGVYGPGAAQMMARPDVVRKLTELAQRRFVHHFSGAVNFAFSRNAPRFLR